MAKSELIELMDAVMEKRDVGPKDLAGHLGVSVASVYQWQKGRVPRDAMRAKITARLRRMNEGEAAQPSLKLAEEPTPLAPDDHPVSLTLDDGNAMKLQMKLTYATARQILNVLFADAR